MEFTDIVSIILPTLSIVAVLVALLSNYRSNQLSQKYNEDRNRAEIEMLRANFEAKIYSLNERLVAKEERWVDSNHLLVKSSINKADNYFDSSIVDPFKFLNGMGIEKDEIRIKKDQAFILTPFHNMYEKEFYIIDKVCHEFGFDVTRGDESFIEGDILSHILKKICESELIIANISGKNPNVFYELGLAHALGKPVIIISKGIDEIPFDLRTKQIVVFKDSLDLSERLKVALLNTIRRKRV